MDNSSVHKAPDKRIEAKMPSVEEQLARKGIEVKFITTYAPMLNPTELCFNLLRQQIEKNRPRSEEELRSAIEKTVELLNLKDLTKYFEHCVNYFDKNDKIKPMNTDKYFA